MLNDLEAGWDVFQNITLVPPDAAERGAAAARANADWIVDDDFTEKMLGRRIAHRMSALGGTGPAVQCRNGRFGLGFTFARILLEVADQKFKLLDVMIKLLRRLSEPRSSKLGELHLQLLDVERLRMEFCDVGSDLDVPARQFRLESFSKNPQCIWVGR
jgi:hypothetical protein